MLRLTFTENENLTTRFDCAVCTAKGQHDYWVIADYDGYNLVVDGKLDTDVDLVFDSYRDAEKSASLYEAGVTEFPSLFVEDFEEVCFRLMESEDELLEDPDFTWDVVNYDGYQHVVLRDHCDGIDFIFPWSAVPKQYSEWLLNGYRWEGDGTEESDCGLDHVSEDSSQASIRPEQWVGDGLDPAICDKVDALLVEVGIWDSCRLPDLDDGEKVGGITLDEDDEDEVFIEPEDEMATVIKDWTKLPSGAQFRIVTYPDRKGVWGEVESADGSTSVVCTTADYVEADIRRVDLLACRVSAGIPTDLSENDYDYLNELGVVKLAEYNWGGFVYEGDFHRFIPQRCQSLTWELQTGEFGLTELVAVLGTRRSHVDSLSITKCGSEYSVTWEDSDGLFDWNMPSVLMAKALAEAVHRGFAPRDDEHYEASLIFDDDMGNWYFAGLRLVCDGKYYTRVCQYEPATDHVGRPVFSQYFTADTDEEAEQELMKLVQPLMSLVD